MIIETRFKDVAEERRFQFNFSKTEEVEAGDLISSVNSVTRSPAGTVPDLTIGGTSTDGEFAQVLVSAGKAGQRYAVKCKVTLTSGAMLVRAGFIEVTDTQMV